MKTSSTFVGRIRAVLQATVDSHSLRTGTGGRQFTAEAEIYVEVIPTPDRSQRILWDVFHSIQYPSAYVPRDDMAMVE